MTSPAARPGRPSMAASGAAPWRRCRLWLHRATSVLQPLQLPTRIKGSCASSSVTRAARPPPPHGCGDGTGAGASRGRGTGATRGPAGGRPLGEPGAASAFSAAKAQRLLNSRTTPHASCSATGPESPPCDGSPQTTTEPPSLSAAKAAPFLYMVVTPLSRSRATWRELPPTCGFPNEITLPDSLRAAKAPDVLQRLTTPSDSSSQLSQKSVRLPGQ
mmetsp:Transcript_13331/g.36770  ORF Transcript_13331/g.36770 Transcript_13331/m.36770 type:complete len:217 (-) Transcript_13331:1023-1673(-)